MVNPFICGTGSFHHQLEEDDDHHIGSPCSTPKKSRKSKNPYADRGLDKFSALLAELEDKKKEIYTQFGSDEISFVRFSFSHSNDCKPIVVKVKERDQKQQEKDSKPMMTNNNNSEVDQPIISVQESRNELGDQMITKKKKKKKGYSWGFLLRKETWSRPSFYLPAVVILILVFLALFGRSFVVLCTSIGWYMVPTISGGRSEVKRVRKKKDYARRASEKRMVVSEGLASPTSVIAGAMNDFSPRQRVHRKSF